MTTPSPHYGGVVSDALAKDRLGVADIVFFQMSAATPFTVVAGVVTTAYAVTGMTAIPFAFIAVACVLALFSVGYVAMSRHVVNAGAFYAYITRGLGRIPGVAAAMIALVAYNMMQVGLYGILGVTTSDLLQQKFGLALPWWVIALVAWALTGVLGVRSVNINSRVLAVLLCAEIVVIVLFDLVFFSIPAQGYDTAPLAPANLFAAGAGALLVLGVTGFVGFEHSTIFAEEARNPKRTVPLATYLTIAIIGTLYAISAWGMAIATGLGDVVTRSKEESVGLIFALTGGFLPAVVIDIANVLLITSILAAMISFHNACARYGFALGRERVLPGGLGRTSATTGAPRNASIAQSVLGLIVILVYGLGGIDPMVWLFFAGGTTGAFGVLCLIAATSIAVVVFFLRDPRGENAWRRLWAPLLSSAALLWVLYQAAITFATLLGVPADSPLRWQLPGLYVIAAAVGVALALWLRARRPVAYTRIGLGAHAAASPTNPTLLTQEA
ncbi:MAG: APC family permease [Micromonosporaceae bacterium]